MGRSRIRDFASAMGNLKAGDDSDFTKGGKGIPRFGPLETLTVFSDITADERDSAWDQFNVAQGNSGNQERPAALQS
mgnify:CR=1 FL=1